MVDFNETSGGGSEGAAQAPEFIGLEDDDLKDIRKPLARVKPGWMLGEVVGRERKVAKTGTLNLRLWFAPLDASGEVVKKGRVPMDIYLPIANKGFINPKTGLQHARPNTVFGCYMSALAFEENFERYPKKLRPGVYENQATGQILTQEQANAQYAKVDENVVRTAIGWYNDDLALLGSRVYMGVEEEQSESDGKTYSKVTKTRKSPPEDESIITDDFFVKG